MPRETLTLSLVPQPHIGDIVLFRPARVNQQEEIELPAIVQRVVEPSHRIVDLTVFAPKGPITKSDIPYGTEANIDRWRFRE